MHGNLNSVHAHTSDITAPLCALVFNLYTLHPRGLSTQLAHCESRNVACSQVAKLRELGA